MSDWAPIPEHSLSPAAEPLEAQNFTLWRDAPGWRNLILAAIGFSVALLTLPFIAASPSSDTTAKETTCQGPSSGSFMGRSGHGEVVGFLNPEQAMKLLQQTQFMTRMAINPDYLSNVRSLVHLDGSVEGSRIVYLVPKGITVHIGDRVDVVGGHVDTNLPCHYIPNLIANIQSQQ
jgi:hypothetical protein